MNSYAGFMSRGVDGVTLGYKLLLQDPWKMAIDDPSVAPVPWNDSLYRPNRKLTIGW